MSEIKKEKLIDFKIGNDPEFSFYSPSSGKVISAGNYLSSEYPKLGVDGNGTTVEVRPSPSSNPLKVVMNIQHIFKEASLRSPKILELDWLGGSFKHGFTHGGHIHFGYDKTNVKIDQTFAAEVLSQYVGAMTILIEDKEEGLNRRSSYGGRVDIRNQDHGLEWRTPSSWLTKPAVASGVLCLAKVVFSEILNNSKLKESYKNLFTNDDFRAMNKNKFLFNFPEIWSTITQMPLYQTYKPYCDYIYWLINKRLSWFGSPSQELKENWGIFDLSSLQKENPNITLQVLCERYRQSIL